MLDILIAAYIFIAVLVGGIFAIATWKLGGFQAYADLANEMADESVREKPFTSNEVQWRMVGYVLFWPVIIWVIFRTLRNAKGN